MRTPIIQKSSPNHGPRVGNGPVDILLLHYTGMPSQEGALEWLCDLQSTVSSHYFVFEDGRIVCMVDEDRRAHHAGVSHWAGETDINSRSIGIEIANPGHEHGYRAFPDKQIDALIVLCRDILSRHTIPPQRVLGHSDVSPARKMDPGELFPWPRLNLAGVGHFVPPAPVREGPVLAVGARGALVANLRDRFRQYGYGLAKSVDFDSELEDIVTAFQRHFRPERVDGVVDLSTRETLDRLLEALGGN